MKLTAAKRKAMPAKNFAEPSKRAYPINDKAHAALAKGRATQQFNRGTMSASQKAAIDHKANMKLGKTFHSHKGSK